MTRGKQLSDINGRLRICTRCNSGDPAVYKKSGEWLCESCLERRKERQAHTATLPKCHRCNGIAIQDEVYCNNHRPKEFIVLEIPSSAIRCEAVVEEVWVDNEVGISVDRTMIEVPAHLIGRKVQVIIIEKESSQ